MKTKHLVLLVSAGLLMGSCVTKKQFTDLQAKQKRTQDLLNTATVKLNACEADKAASQVRITSYEERIAELKKDKQDLIESSKDLTMLTQKGATNLEKSLESLQERDLKINRLQDALNKKDSVSLAIVSSLKKEVGLDDKDIEINVEKGVVFISLSDKMLFKSGSYTVTERAREILAKVAIVINGKPDFEALVEGHTDDVPYSNGPLIDNWDLSVKRSTAIVRELQDLGVQPSQLIAAGRAEYNPLVSNDTPANRAINRRTKIYVLPKIDQFYKMVEDELENLSAQDN
ncbi:MAG: OmpA family protein [Flavobacteriaceae bacterium]